VLKLNKKLTRILFAIITVSISFAVFFVFTGNIVLAQEDFGESNLENINLPQIELIQSVIKIINIILGFLGLIAVIIVIYAGFLWMTAGGKSEQVDKAKKWLVNGLIGLVIIMLSFAITMYVFNVLENKINEANDNGDDIIIIPGDIDPLPQNIFKINSITTSCGNPPNYTQDVYLCSAVVITFNHSLDKNSVSGIEIQDCEKDSNCDNPISTQLDGDWSTTKKSIIFNHSKDFEKNNFYRINIPKSIKDKTGLTLHPSNACGSGTAILPGCGDSGTFYRWKFKTGETIDKVVPEITSTYPVIQSNNNYPDRDVNLAPILTVKFSEAILPTSINKNNIKIRKLRNVNLNNPDNTGTAWVTPLESDQYSVEINSRGNGFEIYDLFLDAFEWYQIEVSGIQDLCNNTMQNKQIWRFQTNDIVRGVKSVYPADGYDKACPDTSILIVFKTSMYDPSTNSCKVTATSQGGGLVAHGNLTPSILRNLQVVDDLPDEANPNKYCKIYEFNPETVLLNVDQTYTANVKTNLVLNQDGDNLEKLWSFKIAPADKCINSPIITRISPNYGSDGTCISIFGRYFGDNIGKATFNKIDLNIDAVAWQDRQITTSIPNPSNLIKADNGTKYPIQIITDFQNSELKSNTYNFRLMQGEPANGPCLWSLSPSKGCFDDKIVAKGIRFGSQDIDSKIIFTTNKTGIIDNWSDIRIETKLPADSFSGDVFIENSIGKSNPVYFDLICKDGDEDEKLKITKWWPRNCTLACRNTELGAKFNLALDENSLNNNINIFKCQNQDCKKEELSAQIKINVNYLEETDNNLYQIDIGPESDLESEKYYRVILNKNIISKDSNENLYSLNYNYLTEKDSFSWVFATQDKICKLDAVDVSPEIKTLTKLNSSQRFRAYALGRDVDNCDGAPLNSYNYDWEWLSSKNSVATILDTTNPTNKAKGLSNGKTNITAKTQGLSDFAVLTVDTSANQEPKEVDFNFQPQGAQECANVSVIIDFNQKMDLNSLKDNISVLQTSVEKLENCTDGIAGKFLCLVKHRTSFRTVDGDYTQMKIFPKNPWLKAEKVKVVFIGGKDGIKGLTGGVLSTAIEKSFNLTADAQICKINSVEIDPANWTFNKKNNTKNFTAIAKNKNNTEINSVSDYSWTWEWNEIDKDDIISISDSNTDTEIVTANNENGRATLIAVAQTSADTTHTAYSQITNNLCLNPWPSSGVYKNDTQYANFSTFYCRDQGSEETDKDDLPALIEQPQATNNSGANILNDYLFLRADDSTDAIGLRIFSNLDHLSPQAWYEAQSFSGSPSNIEVAGYEAIRDGRSVYIAAANLSGASMWTNIYLLSYNENASQETIQIFNELLKNLQFNTNVKNISDRIKIARDAKRVTDLGAIKKYLNNYYENSDQDSVKKHYPKLLAGIYKIGQSTSKWPSWQQTLGKELEQSLPIDPLNDFPKKCESGANPGEICESDNNCPQGQCLIPQCPLPKFDQESCWNDTEKIFVCPSGSHIYQYSSIENATDFNIYATLEYDGDGSWINAGNSNECWNYKLSK